ncbi:MAG: hypothetical protein QW524_01450 [Candidatus Woesearchaeota archaeon]
MDFESLVDSFENTNSELKRAEHSIYVSLKYTRTQDILETIIERLCNTLSNLIDFLIMLKREEPFPKSKRIEIFLQLYEKNFAETIVRYYNLLKIVKKSKKIIVNQYRRHMKMVVEIEPLVFYIVDIDSVIENYKMIKSFVDEAHKMFIEVYSKMTQKESFD